MKCCMGLSAACLLLAALLVFTSVDARLLHGISKPCTVSTERHVSPSFSAQDTSLRKLTTFGGLFGHFWPGYYPQQQGSTSYSWPTSAAVQDQQHDPQLPYDSSSPASDSASPSPDAFETPELPEASPLPVPEAPEAHIMASLEPSSSPSPSPGLDAPEQSDNEVNNTTVEGSSNEDVDGATGQAIVGATQDSATSAAVASGKDAFAVTHAAVDEQGNAQVQGHVEAVDKNGNRISANVWASVNNNISEAQATADAQPAAAIRSLKQTRVNPASSIPRPVNITQAGPTNAANTTANTTSISISTSRYGSGDAEVECVTVTGPLGQSLKCYKATAAPGENAVNSTHASPELPDTAPVIPQPIPVIPTPSVSTVAASSPAATSVAAALPTSQLAGNAMNSVVPSPAAVAAQPSPAPISVRNVPIQLATDVTSNDTTTEPVVPTSANNIPAVPISSAAIYNTVTEPVTAPAVQPAAVANASMPIVQPVVDATTGNTVNAVNLTASSPTQLTAEAPTSNTATETQEPMVTEPNSDTNASVIVPAMNNTALEPTLPLAAQLNETNAQVQPPAQIITDDTVVASPAPTAAGPMAVDNATNASLDPVNAASNITVTTPVVPAAAAYNATDDASSATAGSVTNVPEPAATADAMNAPVQATTDIASNATVNESLATDAANTMTAVNGLNGAAAATNAAANNTVLDPVSLNVVEPTAVTNASTISPEPAVVFFNSSITEPVGPQADTTIAGTVSNVPAEQTGNATTSNTVSSVPLATVAPAATGMDNVSVIPVQQPTESPAPVVPALGTVQNATDITAQPAVDDAPINTMSPLPPATPTEPVTDSDPAFTATPIVSAPDSTVVHADVPAASVTSAADAAPEIPATPVDDAINAALNKLFGVTWETAPTCTAKPNKRNSVQDTLGRLWWTENGRSCAYKQGPNNEPFYFDGYVQVKWETSPKCTFAATWDNSMADSQGRLWSWIEQSLENCVFTAADGIAPLMRDSFQ